jgi:hypothetical protein
MEGEKHAGVSHGVATKSAAARPQPPRSFVQDLLTVLPFVLRSQGA